MEMEMVDLEAINQALDIDKLRLLDAVPNPHAISTKGEKEYEAIKVNSIPDKQRALNLMLPGQIVLVTGGYQHGEADQGAPHWFCRMPYGKVVGYDEHVGKWLVRLTDGPCVDEEFLYDISNLSVGDDSWAFHVAFHEQNIQKKIQKGKAISPLEALPSDLLSHIATYVSQNVRQHGVLTERTKKEIRFRLYLWIVGVGSASIGFSLSYTMNAPPTVKYSLFYVLWIVFFAPVAIYAVQGDFFAEDPFFVRLPLYITCKNLPRALFFLVLILLFQAFYWNYVRTTAWGSSFEIFAEVLSILGSYTVLFTTMFALLQSFALSKRRIYEMFPEAAARVTSLNAHFMDFFERHPRKIIVASGLVGLGAIIGIYVLFRNFYFLIFDDEDTKEPTFKACIDRLLRTSTTMTYNAAYDVCEEESQKFQG